MLSKYYDVYGRYAHEKSEKSTCYLVGKCRVEKRKFER